jgi:hypothetical protein
VSIQCVSHLIKKQDISNTNPILNRQGVINNNFKHVEKINQEFNDCVVFPFPGKTRTDYI